ncbi:DUF6092 family protein [Actinomadura harenae]|uniref:Uncharacterized protein n=1 Tax=Actinomadura harenae TaxID=2483351 RepID=A0A3M2M3L0_9ACTN|nr:DUF6092 family protein [Actinomadura harenae]RMI44354.1 hypothetical protein EBO15_13240 [Actinomadura harenae]
MSAGTDREIGEELLLLTAYLLSSGRGLFDEPRAYGPLRCADAARRALALAEQSGIDNEEVHAIRTRLDDVVQGAMGETQLDDLLDHLCERMATVLHDSDLITPTQT